MAANYMYRMVYNLKPYPAYKDSGVPWLGEVPEHWDVRRVKRIARLNPSKSEVPLALRDGRAVFLPMERVGSDGRFDASEVQPISDLWNGFTYFRRGDVIVAKITPCFENGKGACLENLPTAFGFGSTEFHVIRPSKTIVSAYLYRVTTLSEFRRLGADEMTGAAGQQRVPVEFIANFPTPIPPLPEQTAIVRFLDYMDRRIRRYIRAKQKLIKLLEEYKQALIHQAVNGQIDVRTGKPYPAYKDSGVEWLGHVPAHWEVTPIKRAFSSMDYGISESGSDSGTIRLLTMGHLKNGQLIIPDAGGVDTVDPNLLLSPGDLLFNRTNSAELVGKVALFSGYKSPVTFASYLVRMRPTKENEPEFLNLVLNDASTLSRARREAIPSLHQSNLNPTRYGRLCIALPPKAEQQAILQRLREQTENIDAAIAAARREIELLREYRTRLIADVVTGKVDVREVAAQLPEEPPEEEAELMDTDEIAEGEATDDDAAAEALSEEEVEP